MSLINMKVNLWRNKSSYEWFHMQTRFNTEVKGNSQMAYYTGPLHKQTL